MLGPLSKLQREKDCTSYVLVIDALDECDDVLAIGMILQLLADAKALKTAQLRILLTSRPEVPIRYGFSQMQDSEHKDIILHEIPRSIVDHDISVFLEWTLKAIADKRSLPTSWPGEENIRKMVQIADGLFIWAATACKFIGEGQQHIATRLDLILEKTRSATIASKQYPERYLDEIYTTVLKNSVPSEFTDTEKQKSYRMLRRILGSIIVLSSPLPISALSRLLSEPEDSINQALEDLHSVLNIPKNRNFPLRLHHPSFRDFLFKRDRCKDRNFWIDENEANEILANHCLQCMTTSLKQDICGVHYPGVLVSNIEHSIVEQFLSVELQYSCLYWVQHLQKDSMHLKDNGKVHLFLKKHLLHWLEALSWMQRIPDGVLSTIQLDSLASSQEDDTNRYLSSQNTRKSNLTLYRKWKDFSKKKSNLRRMIKKISSSIGVFNILEEEQEYQV